MNILNILSGLHDVKRKNEKNNKRKEKQKQKNRVELFERISCAFLKCKKVLEDYNIIGFSLVFFFRCCCCLVFVFVFVLFYM